MTKYGSHGTFYLDEAAFSVRWLDRLASARLSLLDMNADSLLVSAHKAQSPDMAIAVEGLLAVARANGSPFSFGAEGESLVEDVMSSSSSIANRIRIAETGFRTYFGPVTKSRWSHWSFRPEFAILLCMEVSRNYSVFIRIVAADEVASALSRETFELLKEPLYRFPVSHVIQSASTFADDFYQSDLPIDDRRWSILGPIFAESATGRIQCAAKLPTIETYLRSESTIKQICNSIGAIDALGKLLAVLSRPDLGRTVELKSGSILAFSNMATLHAKTDYVHSALGHHRMLRTYSTSGAEEIRYRSDELVV